MTWSDREGSGYLLRRNRKRIEVVSPGERLYVMGDFNRWLGDKEKGLISRYRVQIFALGHVVEKVLEKNKVYTFLRKVFGKFCLLW